jgi:hypothetical protein
MRDRDFRCNKLRTVLRNDVHKRVRGSDDGLWRCDLKSKRQTGCRRLNFEAVDAILKGTASLEQLAFARYNITQVGLGIPFSSRGPTASTVQLGV